MGPSAKPHHATKDDSQQQAPRINVVQLTTIFYKLQNSDHIQEYLSADIKKTMKIEQQTEEVLANLTTT